MAKRATPDARTRRIAAGLSPVLLDHAEEGQRFLGFLSYRRQDALSLARWLRGKITGFKVPNELKAKIEAQDASVGGKQNRVFFDMSYQKPNVDFWDEHIAASLCRSRTLVLLQTPSVFERLPDGSANWCEREIETFLKYYGDPSRILVVMGPGAPIDRFPPPLEKISARWDWIDLRFFSQSWLQRFRLAGQYDAQVVKVLAKIYDIADGDLPVLNREFANARGRVRRNLAVAAMATIVALSGLTAWALKERETAIAQRNSALVSQSRYLASGADQLVKDGTIRGAIALVRAGLPDAAAGNDRPLVPEAIASAYDAMYSNHEQGRLDLPADTTALASDAIHDKIVLTTKDQFVVRGGFESSKTQSWPLDFEPTKQVVLSPDAKVAALVSEDGAVMLRSLEDNRVILRHPGEGSGTLVQFTGHGTSVIISDATRQHLHLIDAATGAEKASRILSPSTSRSIVSLFDAESDLLMVVLDGKLIRLSPADLSDASVLPLDDAEDYALGLSQDKQTLYVAVSKALLDGRMLEVDAGSWMIKRELSHVIWGAKKLDVSSRWHTLALIGLNGVDFFDTLTGERTSHVATTFAPTGGQFLGGTEDSNYMIYGGTGAIQWISPILATVTTSFQTVDGGVIKALDPLPNRQGFLSVSDIPSVTRWSYTLVATAADFQIPLIASGLDFKTPTFIQAHDYNRFNNTVVGAYGGNAVYRWNIATGEKTLVKSEEPHGLALPLVANLNPATVAVADANGKIGIYTTGGGANAPAGEVDAGPLDVLATVDDKQAFVVTKEGKPELLDLTDPHKPKLVALPSLGQCPLSGGAHHIALCATRTGHVGVLRVDEGKISYERPESAPAFNVVETSLDASLVAVATHAGGLEIRKMPEGTLIESGQLQLDLSGARLASALSAGALSADDVQSLRHGATHLLKAFGATALAFSPDGTQLAAALPFGVVRITEVATGKSTDISLPRGTFVQGLIYSGHGALLAIDEIRKIEVMEVFRVATGDKVAEISLGDQFKPKIYALPDGTGYLTISEMGHIIVNPIFEHDADFLAYLAREYPEKLTPAQRKAYFLE